MPEYLPAPSPDGRGRTRVPDSLGQPSYASGMFAEPHGEEVELWFTRTVFDPDAEPDGATHEAVARIFMTRNIFESLATYLPLALEAWRAEGC